MIIHILIVPYFSFLLIKSILAQWLIKATAQIDAVYLAGGRANSELGKSNVMLAVAISLCNSTNVG